MSSGAASSRPHVIVVTLLANYYPILLLFLNSIKRRYPSHPEIVVCQKGFSPEQIGFLHSRYEGVRCFNIEGRVVVRGPAMLGRDYPDLDAFYARFLIWSDLFDEYENVLYLDIDALIVGPLDELLNRAEFQCFEESYAGEQPYFYDASDPQLRMLLAEDGVPALPPVPGNAGVMLIPRRYRTFAQLAELQRLLNRYEKHLIWGDQSLINLWMARYGIVPVHDPRYNFQVRFLVQRRYPAEFRDVRFLHLAGLHHMGVMEYMMQSAYVLNVLIPVTRRWYPGFLRAHVDNGMLRWRQVTRRLFVALTLTLGRLSWVARGVPLRLVQSLALSHK